MNYYKTCAFFKKGKPNVTKYERFFSCPVMVLLVHVGLIGGWASPSFALLTASDSPIPLDEGQAYWVASLVNLSRFFGGIFGALCTSYFGSKKAILVAGLPIGLGWLLVVSANSVDWLYLSRLSSGLGLGMALGSFPLYLGEVSMPEIRGALVSLATMGACFGQVTASVCGSYLSINSAAFVYFLLGVVLLLFFLCLPESPHHLVKTGNHEAARRSVSWYRGGRGVEEELEAIKKFVAADTALSFAGKLELFRRSPPIRRAAVQIIALFSFMQICGLNIVMFFMETILMNAKFTLIRPAVVVIYVNVLSTFAAIASIFLIDRCGRKFLLIVSSAGTTVSMVGLMIHFMTMDRTNSQWLPMASILLFMLAYFLGLMCVPSAILSEIFPANVKCIASCIAILTGAVTSFASAATYPLLVDLVGDAYVFLLYAILSAVIIPYTMLALRETKGKSLQQIQDELIK